jgi:hypothetical protein
MLPGYAGANETPWFTVTAADAQGRESACAGAKELVRWGPFADAAVKRDDPKTVTLVLHPGASWVQLRNSFVVTKGAALAFQINTQSPRPLALRLAVAGLGDVDLPLTKLPAGGAKLDDGQWHPVTLNLREPLDKLAAEKKVTPAQARTTWNEDWLVTDCRLGDFGADAKEAATFEFKDVAWTLPR